MALAKGSKYDVNLQSEVTSSYLTYCGKPVEKMNRQEVELEIQIQKWFAKRADRMCYPIVYGNEIRRKELEADTRIADMKAKYERGEATWGQLLNVMGAVAKKQKAYDIRECQIEFLKMHSAQALSVVRACEERLPFLLKKKKRKRPYNPRRKWAKRMSKPRYDPARNVATKYTYWMNAVEKKGLGNLWDKEKYMAICSDRGLGSIMLVINYTANILELTQRQAEFLLDRGAFSWMQVLELGADLEMTPKEFADTFLSGYFVELAEGDFRASTKNLPFVGELPTKAVDQLKPEEDSESDGGGTEQE